MNSYRLTRLIISILLLLMFFASLLFNALGLYGMEPTPKGSFSLNPQTEKETETIALINNSVVGERIQEFDTITTINRDGSIAVRETIDYYFDTQRHGIYRYIPYTKRNDEGKRVDLTFSDFTVTTPDQKKYKADISRQNEQWVLKIGDPNKTISGKHTYIISYTVKGALGYFDDHDELYWNVTGNGWDVPIQKAKITINFPEKISPEKVKLACYTGHAESTKQNCTGGTDGQKTTIQTTLFLNSYEGLTVVKGFPKGMVETLLPTVYTPFFERWYGKITLAGIIIAAIFWYVLLPIYLVYRWFTKGKDPDVGPAVTAHFDPPKVGKSHLTPAETGALLDEHVDRRDLFATIIDLARRGHIKIVEPKEKEFHLVKMTPKKHNTLLPFEQTLYDGVFATGDDVKLKEVKFYTTAMAVETEIYKLMVEHEYFPKNPRTTRNIYYGLGAAGMVTFNFVLAFAAFVFGRFMPRKTLLGAQTSKQAEGLKNFLSSQERQLNFQGDKQMLFERLLPFATAFGVEKAWAKRFEHIDLKNPDWYQGTSSSHFNSALFASHLSNSYNSFASSSTPPSSSSSGFSGGSSGGGGGGGGGGSW